MALKDWSTTAASNATITDGTYGNITWAENQNPNTVNDSARAEMAHVRAFYETLEWRDWGHTVTRTGNTTFTISSASDLSSIYTVGRRIRCTDSSTLYGKITVSSYAASTQTVTVSLDSGNLSASLTAVALGLDPTNKSVGVAVIEKGTEGYHLKMGSANAEWATPYQAVTVYLSTDQGHSSSGSWVDVAFDLESFDPLEKHSAGTFTVPSWANKARFSAVIAFEGNGASATGRRAARVVTGAGALLTPYVGFVTDPSADVNGDTYVPIGGPLVPVTAGGTYKFQAYQNSGGTIQINGTNAATWATVEFFP